MIAWLIFLSLMTIFLWWLGGIMMHNHTPIQQELTKMRDDDE